MGRVRPTRTLAALALAVVAAAALAANVMRPTQRPAKPSGGHPRAEAQLAKVLPAVHFDHTPLRDVVATLGRQSGVKIVLDEPALLLAEMDPATPVELHLRGVTLDQTLAALVRYVSSPRGIHYLDYTASGDAIVLTTSEGLADHMYGRLYDARDIHAGWLAGARESWTGEAEPELSGQGIFSSPTATGPGLPTPQELDDELKYLLQETVAIDFWYEAGGHGRVEVLGGHVLVVAAWTHHRQIEDILRQLREPPVPRERLPHDGPLILATKPE